MFINDLGMAGGGCDAVNAIHWHTAVAAHKERQGGRGQGAWWTSILMPSLACVLLPWAPAEVQTEQPDPSGRAPLSSYQQRPQLSWRFSKDVPETSSDELLMFQEVAQTWGQKFGRNRGDSESQNVESKVKFRALETNEYGLIFGAFPSTGTSPEHLQEFHPVRIVRADQ